MPNRIIKDSICTSDSIDQLSWFEEVLFYRLIVSCDDYGRYDGRIPVIKNRLFPLRDNLTTKSVELAINKLASIGLIALYEVSGRPILCLPSWDEHQSVRAKRSKYPPPDPESKCIHMNSDESKCPRNPIQSESKSESKSESNPIQRTRAIDEDFEIFWEKYPRKFGKDNARAAFEGVDVSLDVLLDAIKRQSMSDQWKQDGGKYIPGPEKWLAGKRWLDVLPESSGNVFGSCSLGDAEQDAIRRILNQP